ncbi:MAG: site-specific integrase [Roseibacillus sp.]
MGAQNRNRGDYVDVRAVAKTSEHFKKHRYRWIVEARLNDKRIRKYFRNGQASERDICEAELKALIDEHSKDTRDKAADHKLQKLAVEADSMLAPFGKTIVDAARFYANYLEQESTKESTPLSQVIQKFLKEKKQEGVSDLHQADLRQRLARFDKAHPNRSLSSFTRNEISEWILALPVGPQARINQRRILHNLFRYAVDSELLSTNPVTTAAKGIKVRRKKTVILLPEEVSTLLKHCTAKTLPAVCLMVFCGIRKDEVGRLDWKDIDWEDCTVEVSAENAKRESHARHVTIPANAIKWLRPLKKLRGPIAPFKTSNVFTKALQDTRREAGWEPGQWPNNALRKTFISCHYESFGSIDETARQAGTSVGIIHRYYRKLIKPAMAKKLWKISP